MRALFVEWEFDSLLARVDKLARPAAPAAVDDQLHFDI
jgi:hypothetical protein